MFADFGVGGTKVGIFPLKANVQFGSNGVPTPTSMQKIVEEVAGFRSQSPETVSLAYFETSEEETLALDNWIRESESKKAPYALIGNSCRDYCLNGMRAAGLPADYYAVIPGPYYVGETSAPNQLMQMLRRYAQAYYEGEKKELKPKVTSRLCTEQQPCPVQ